MCLSLTRVIRNPTRSWPHLARVARPLPSARPGKRHPAPPRPRSGARQRRGGEALCPARQAGGRRLATATGRLRPHPPTTLGEPVIGLLSMPSTPLQATPANLSLQTHPTHTQVLLKSY